MRRCSARAATLLISVMSGCTVSQTDVNYRGSPLSEGQLGSVRGGDRLPWVKMADIDNYASLTALDWQVHVYGEATEDLRRLCAARNLKL